MNTWPNGYRHAMSQDDHEQWNATHFHGTRQLCCRCEEFTGCCEDDSIYTFAGEGPMCLACWQETDEYKASA